jgi:hypothetical protein
MGQKNKPSNKERDGAISKLYQAVDGLMKEVQSLHQGVQFSLKRLDHYIDWRRDGKRYRRSVEKASAKEKARIAKLESETKPDGVQEAPTTIEEGVIE